MTETETRGTEDHKNTKRIKRRSTIQSFSVDRLTPLRFSFVARMINTIFSVIGKSNKIFHSAFSSRFLPTNFTISELMFSIKNLTRCLY